MGEILSLNKCIDCDASVSTSKTLRCRSCSKKGRLAPSWKGGVAKQLFSCIICKIKTVPYCTWKTGRGLCLKCVPKYLSKIKMGRNAPGYKDGRFKKRNCMSCYKKINKGSYQRRCQSCAKIFAYKNPKNHPNYIEGRSLSKYSSDFNKKLKETIRKRDKNKCRKCNIKQKNLKRKLSVHHIDYDKKNCKENNLISLCLRCHLKTIANRNYWFAYYVYIMENTSSKWKKGFKTYDKPA